LIIKSIERLYVDPKSIVQFSFIGAKTDENLTKYNRSINYSLV